MQRIDKSRPRARAAICRYGLEEAPGKRAYGSTAVRSQCGAVGRVKSEVRPAGVRGDNTELNGRIRAGKIQGVIDHGIGVDVAGDGNSVERAGEAIAGASILGLSECKATTGEGIRIDCERDGRAYDIGVKAAC